MRTLLVPLVLAGGIAAQEFPFLPGVRHDAAVPTLQQIVGHDWGTEISSHAEIERYARALAERSDRVAVFEYGRTWENRTLLYLAVSSPQNLQRLAEVKAGMQRLADPRRLDQTAARDLVAGLPAVAMLAYTVHGDEISGSDAGLLLGYHLAAAVDDPLVGTILDQAIVLIDPLANPDGRDRFVHHYRQTRGRWPDAEPDAAEHNQPWPGGRTNHYLFDMNRDWFAMSQPETRARVALLQEWWPVVYADLHEMGGNSTYYFAPPALPINPEITAGQRQWLERYGRNNAAWFDRFGFAYFVREDYDSFYPGYGDGWPTYHGSIGMTYEQGSPRGLLFRRKDETVLEYRQAVRHHFIASLATCETAARGRQEALQGFLDYRRSAVQEGATGPVREFVLPDRGDRGRLAELVQSLRAQGLEVHRAAGELQNTAAVPYLGGEASAQTFPAGSYVVRLAQPGKRLATVLLSRHQEMDAAFLARQKARESRRKDTEFYDLTAWSLPLLYGVECWPCGAASQGELRLLAGDEPLVAVALPDADPKVAWLLPWDGNGSAAMLVDLLRQGVLCRQADEAFTIDGRRFPPGSVVVRVHPNGPDLHRQVREAAVRHRVQVQGVDSAWVDDGISLGSNKVLPIEPPKVALAWDRPCNANSAGWARFLLEQRYGLPVTLLRTHQLGSADLDRYTVLVLPDGGGFGAVIGKGGAERIAQWVRRGGVLVTMGGSTRWLGEEGVKLLAVAPEDRQKPEGKEEPGEKPGEKPGEQAGEKPAEKPAAKPAEPFDYERAIQPEKEPPPSTPGAILTVTLDSEHWLAFGYEDRAFVVNESNAIYPPLKLDQGTNVAVYEQEDRLVTAGFTWEAARKQLARKAFLVHQPHGKGHVVAFAEDPNVRAFAQGLNLLLLNAILLSPGR